MSSAGWPRPGGARGTGARGEHQPRRQTGGADRGHAAGDAACRRHRALARGVRSRHQPGRRPGGRWGRLRHRRHGGAAPGDGRRRGDESLRRVHSRPSPRGGSPAGRAARSAEVPLGDRAVPPLCRPERGGGGGVRRHPWRGGGRPEGLAHIRERGAPAPRPVRAAAGHAAQLRVGPRRRPLLGPRGPGGGAPRRRGGAAGHRGVRPHSGRSSGRVDGPRRAVAAQSRVHDRRRVSLPRARAVARAAGRVPVGARRRPVPRRGGTARRRRRGPEGRQRHGRLRLRRAPRRRRVVGGAVPRRRRREPQPAAVLPQRGRRRVLGPDHRGGARRPRQRPARHPRRLRQRRVPRPAGPARRVAGGRAPQLAPPEQRRRHVQRRYRGGRPADAGADAGRGVGRLRQRRLGRPVHRQRDPGRCVGRRVGVPVPPVPQQPRRDLHRRRGGGRRGGGRVRQGRRLGRLRQRRADRPLRHAAAPRSAQPALPQRGPRPGRCLVVPRRRGRGGGRGAAGELSHLVLRLRQRRLGGPVRQRIPRGARRRGPRAPRAAAPGPAAAPLSQRGRRHVHRRHRGHGPGPDHGRHGVELRRPRQRRVPRHVPGHGRPRLPHAHPQPDVPQRGGGALSGRHLVGRLRPLAEGARRVVRRPRRRRRSGPVPRLGRRLRGRHLSRTPST